MNKMKKPKRSSEIPRRESLCSVVWGASHHSVSRNFINAFLSTVDITQPAEDFYPIAYMKGPNSRNSLLEKWVWMGRFFNF
jgi:hypothetical protein